MAKFVVLEVSWGSETEHVVNFSHRPVFKSHIVLTASDVNQGLSPSLSLCYFPAVMATVPSGMLYIINILIKIQKQHKILLKMVWKTGMVKVSFDTIKRF